MTHVLFTALVVRIVDWTFTLLALAGVLICLFTAIDAQLDLRARVALGLNGTLLITGRIARRGALASMGLHLGFLLIGGTAVMGPLPPPDRYQRAVAVATIFILIQLGIVLAQVRNQIDRAHLRSLTGEAHA